MVVVKTQCVIFSSRDRRALPSSCNSQWVFLPTATKDVFLNQQSQSLLEECLLLSSPWWNTRIEEHPLTWNQKQAQPSLMCNYFVRCDPRCMSKFFSRMYLDLSMWAWPPLTSEYVSEVLRPHCERLIWIWTQRGHADLPPPSPAPRALQLWHWWEPIKRLYVSLPSEHWAFWNSSATSCFCWP